MAKDKKTIIEDLLKELLDHLEVQTKAAVKEDKEGVVHIQLETDDPGVLIGYHGETLTSLQLLLALMNYRQTNEWKRILVDVGDYRERRKESLERMALSAAQKVKFSGEEQALPFMTAAERRLIHLALTEDEEVMTESEGEGRNRRVVIKPKR
jgi:spoIIIJ-associated protein